MFVFVALSRTTSDANRTILAITTLSEMSAFSTSDHQKNQHVQTAYSKDAYNNKLFCIGHLETENLVYRETEREEIDKGIRERVVFEVNDRVDGT